MPSLFSAPAVDAVFNRIHKLRADSAPRWGTMSASSMLQHCRIVTESMLQQKPSTRSASLKQRVVRALILNGILKIPRGRTMPKHIADQMNAAGQADFEAEKTGLIHALEAFTAFNGTMSGAHPHFGKMSHAEWGSFAWVHLDHHLRQFGV